MCFVIDLGVHFIISLVNNLIVHVVAIKIMTDVHYVDSQMKFHSAFTETLGRSDNENQSDGRTETIDS